MTSSMDTTTTMDLIMKTTISTHTLELSEVMSITKGGDTTMPHTTESITGTGVTTMTTMATGAGLTTEIMEPMTTTGVVTRAIGDMMDTGGMSITETGATTTTTSDGDIWITENLVMISDTMAGTTAISEPTTESMDMVTTATTAMRELDSSTDMRTHTMVNGVSAITPIRVLTMATTTLDLDTTPNTFTSELTS